MSDREHEPVPFVDTLEFEVFEDTDGDAELVEVTALGPDGTVGTASGRIEHDDEENGRIAYFENVIVRDKKRQGIGRRLVETVAEAFRDRGFTEMEGSLVSYTGLRTLASVFGSERILFEISQNPTAYADAEKYLGASDGKTAIHFRVPL